MSSAPQQALGVLTPTPSMIAPVQESIAGMIQELIDGLPRPERLSNDERRGIIARYTAVLEGNFIYWMTATYLAASSGEAHAIIEDNLREEVRDNHPGMLRKFAVTAQAYPRDVDGHAVSRPLQNVRLFVGRLSSVKLVAMMAFFEGFIMNFMPYLADLAVQQGSTELEYTDVHGVVDVGHTQGLFRALEAELAQLPEPRPTTTQMLEGAEILRALIHTTVHARS